MSINPYQRTTCRICGNKNLYPFLSLGSMPIPNGFLTSAELSTPEPTYLLGVVFCGTCTLVQLTHVVPANFMFANYLYIPSTSYTLLTHFRSLAESLIHALTITSADLVVDVGSNDGTLLGYFKAGGVRVLGVDPATNLAKTAQNKGLDTLNSYFNTQTAHTICQQHGKAKLITATNVLAHIDTLHDFCESVNLLLQPDGVLVLETPYVVDMLMRVEYDTIYHEHLSYFSLEALKHLFALHHLHVFDIQHFPIHGGTIRMFVAKNPQKYPQTAQAFTLFTKEQHFKLTHTLPYDTFRRHTQAKKRSLVALLKTLTRAHNRIVGYGAAAKGNVLLNYCQITPSLLGYIVDSIPLKQGRFTPGTHIPIFPENHLTIDPPTHILILAWNFAKEIIHKQHNFQRSGGKFILTTPTLTIK